jgi:RNA polymerase sigma factor (sigma-70 family)
MPEKDDITLLREYAEAGSEAAFAALVERYVNLVYSTAWRSVGDPHTAEEITQAVFIILAKKARNLSNRTILSGWLYQTTRLTAANFLRGEIRRQRREQEAYMQSLLNEPEPDIWPQIAPLLDAAMGRLGERDRNAIVLRYFENKNLHEVGLALGASEDAAKMRVNRALEKLRKFFTKRGVALSGAAIAGAVSANSVQAAPMALAKSITAVAVTKGAAVSGSTLTLIKGVLKIMAWTKAKTAVVAGVAVLLTAGTTTVVVMKSTNAIRRANPPDLQGAWEGVAEILGTSGVLPGEKARSRVVFQFFKTNGAYSATGEFIDTAPEPFQVTTFAYDYPSVRFTVGRNLTCQGKLKAGATEIAATIQRGTLSSPVLLKRTSVPDSPPEPLAKSEYTPQAGSDLQGIWKAALGSGRSEVRVTIKIAEPSPGTFRAELDNLTTSWLGQPLTVTYNPPEVKLLVASGAGMFQGELRNGNTEMAGNWLQGGRQTPMVFKRADR